MEDLNISGMGRRYVQKQADDEESDDEDFEPITLPNGELLLEDGQM